MDADRYCNPPLNTPRPCFGSSAVRVAEGVERLRQDVRDDGGLIRPRGWSALEVSLKSGAQKSGGAMTTITLESDSSHSPPFVDRATFVPLEFRQKSL